MVQFFFVPEQKHWVVTSYLDGEVRLYDSCFPGKLSKSLEQQIAQVYYKAQGEDTLNITIVPVQSQRGGTDCGVLAIAFAYHAVVGDNLAVITFDQSQIREHLAHCYQEKKLSPFPQRPIQRRPRKLRTLSIEMHCQCGRPDSMQDMIGCDSCNRWFHLNCGNVTSIPVDDWFCYDCL